MKFTNGDKLEPIELFFLFNSSVDRVRHILFLAMLAVWLK